MYNQSLVIRERVRTHQLANELIKPPIIGPKTGPRLVHVSMDGLME